MRKVVATLIAGLFATSVFAQTAPAADTRADAKADKADVKAEKAAEHTEAKSDKMTASATHK